MEKKMHEDKGVLRVQMLGSFSVVWRGEQIAGGSRAKESQFTHLMQILLYYGEKGVSRNWLEEVLFGERDIGNIHHSLRSVLYNARKKLKEAGLPEVEYIWQRNGIFYWTDEIPVEKDTEHFESLCRRAEEAEDSEKKLDYLLDACYRYNGDFLPQQAGVIWAAQEARRLQSMFFACVEKAAVLLREREDWLRMKELGVYVTRVSPFADWEVITMEALVSMGCMAEARKLYDDTVESYMQELGCRPSRKLMELFDRLGTQMHHNYAMLDAIQSELQGEAEKSPGGVFTVLAGVSGDLSDGGAFHGEKRSVGISDVVHDHRYQGKSAGRRTGAGGIVGTAGGGSLQIHPTRRRRHEIRKGAISGAACQYHQRGLHCGPETNQFQFPGRAATDKNQILCQQCQLFRRQIGREFGKERIHG